MAFAVPLQVIFAFGVAGMVVRAKAGVGFFRTVFYLPTLAPPVAATLGFVYILNPATGPVNTMLGWFGITGPLWFESPAWAKPSLVLLGLWGVGNVMIIFLAALLDVPRHLYESAQLDGAGALAAAALGHPAGGQPGAPVRRRHRRHRGAAVLHAGLRGEQHRRRRRRATRRIRPTGSATPRARRCSIPLLLYQQGFRFFNMGYASAMAIVLLVVAFAVTADHHPQLAPLGALPGGDALMSTASVPVEVAAGPAPAAALVRRRPPRAVRRQPRLIAIADHSILIALAIMFLAPFVVHGPHGADDRRPGALLEAVAASRFTGATSPRSSTRRRSWRYTANTMLYAGLATIGVLVSSIPVAYALSRLRWRGRDAVFLLVLATMMLPAQVTAVPLYVMWSKLHLVGSLAPLIIPNWFGDAFSIFLLRQFFLTIPEEYSDAARVDGCGELRILLTVSCGWPSRPSRPSALFAFLYAWNDFFGPLLYTGENAAPLDAVARAGAVPHPLPGRSGT